MRCARPVPKESPAGLRKPDERARGVVRGPATDRTNRHDTSSTAKSFCVAKPLSFARRADLAAHRHAGACVSAKAWRRVAAPRRYFPGGRALGARLTYG